MKTPTPCSNRLPKGKLPRLFQLRIACVLLLIGHVNALAQFPAQPKPLLEFRAGDRVAFLGEAVFGPEREHGFLEQMLTAGAGGAAVTFRHLSLTNGLLASYQPTVVFLHLTPEKFLPGAEAVLGFSNRMETLVSMVQTQAAARARFVLLGPLPLEKRPAPQPDPGPENTTRAGHDRVLKQLAQAHRMTFVSLFDGLRHEFASPKEALTTNGTQLNLRGSQQVAGAIAGGLQIMHHWRMSIEPDGREQPGGFGHAVTNLVRKGGLISFTSLSDKLENAPAPVSGTNGNFIITPVLLRLKLLPPGRHALRIDGQVAMEAMDREWQRGLPITAGPMYEQSDKLRRAIVRKNALTDNAPAGDAVLAEIRRLARPVPHKFEVVPAAADGRVKP